MDGASRWCFAENGTSEGLLTRFPLLQLRGNRGNFNDILSDLKGIWDDFKALLRGKSAKFSPAFTWKKTSREPITGVRTFSLNCRLIFPIVGFKSQTTVLKIYSIVLSPEFNNEDINLLIEKLLFNGVLYILHAEYKETPYLGLVCWSIAIKLQESFGIHPKKRAWYQPITKTAFETENRTEDTTTSKRSDLSKT